MATVSLIPALRRILVSMWYAEDPPMLADGPVYSPDLKAPSPPPPPCPGKVIPCPPKSRLKAPPIALAVFAAISRSFSIASAKETAVRNPSTTSVIPLFSFVTASLSPRKSINRFACLTAISRPCFSRISTFLVIVSINCGFSFSFWANRLPASSNSVNRSPPSNSPSKIWFRASPPARAKGANACPPATMRVSIVPLSKANWPLIESSLTSAASRALPPAFLSLSSRASTRSDAMFKYPRKPRFPRISGASSENTKFFCSSLSPSSFPLNSSIMSGICRIAPWLSNTATPNASQAGAWSCSALVIFS